MSLATCAPVSTGSAFLKSSLTYLDCAGQAIGSVGYNALAQPGSIIGQLTLTAITLFIAWHGIRMMFGHTPGMSDAVVAVAKIGLVLMLVTSWPAVRTLFAAPVSGGPAELVAGTGLGGPLPLDERLQRADDGMVALTKWGTGRLDIRAGQTADGRPAASEFRGAALTDSLALGLGRLAFLISSLMSLGLMRLLGGIMIAALPIFAGLLLFDVTRGIFLGWLRLIAALFIAGFAVPLILAVELSLLEPWLSAAIEQRTASFATPSAPTELLAMSSAFLLIITASMAFITRACFTIDPGAAVRRMAGQVGQAAAAEPAIPAMHLVQAGQTTEISRAERLAMTLNHHAHRPDPAVPRSGDFGGRALANDGPLSGADYGHSVSTRRRARQRASLSQIRRNQR